jgi:hypothetical protein
MMTPLTSPLSRGRPEKGAASVMTGRYEPPLSTPGGMLIPGQEPMLAPGVRGYAVEHRGRIYIPVVAAEKEGSGDVGRFLDSLSPRCVFPCVISNRLRAMLQRRGYVMHIESDNDGEPVDVWSKDGAA